MEDFEVLKKYFPKERLEQMSMYQKTRYKNQVDNYRHMERLGLNIALPQFMKKEIPVQENDFLQSLKQNVTREPNKEVTPKKRRKGKGESSEDEDWQPETQIKKSARIPQKKIEQSDTVNRYPKRNLAVPNYKEAHVSKCHDFMVCDICERKCEGECEEHPLNIIQDNPVPINEEDEQRPVKTAPPQVQIGPSKIPDGGDGVWTTEVIPARTRFGPYEGKIVPADNESGYGWVIRKNDKPHHCIDASSRGTSNWMRFVNCPRNVAEENLVAYQYDGKIYYRTTREIPPLTELLVHYGDSYGNELGISSEEYRSERKEPLKNLTFNCGTCQLTFASPVFLKRHICRGKRVVLKDAQTVDSGDLSSSERRFACESCPARFSRQNDLNSHMRVHTGVKPFGYSKCNKFFTQASNLSTHKRMHTGEKPYMCEHCSKAFTNSSNLKDHVRLHTGEKPYVCEHCSKAFTKSSHLKDHVRLHTGEKPYVCEHCSKAFTNSSHLKYHVRLHTGEKPYVCEHCSKAFTQPITLKSHVRLHTGEKPYVCEHCSKAFTNSSHLKDHVRLHTGEKPYVCEHCSKAFTQSITLKSHVRLHTGEKPYVCEHCSKAFTKSSHLKDHVRLHTGEKPYVCEHCSKAFTNSSNLKAHVRLHTGEKPYTCAHCTARFKHKISLTKHLKTHLKSP